MLIAVTGSTGFLGQSFVAHAIDAGHSIRALVASDEAAARLPSRISLVRGRLGDAASIRELVDGADVLVHLAAVGVQASDRNWEGLVDVNVMGTMRVLSAAAGSSVKHAVLAGTCLEYRGFGRLPEASCPDLRLCDEESPLGNADPYGATKAAAALVATALSMQLGFPLWYLRFSSMYGAGDNPRKLIPSAISAARARRRFVMTPGEQVRDWLHVDDACRALMMAVGRRPIEPTVLNVGTGEPVKIRRIVDRIFEVCGAPASLIEVEPSRYRRNEPHVLVLDCARVAAALGWGPTRHVLEALSDLARQGASAT